MQEQETIAIVIDRGAQAISQKRIDQFGVKTHPKELVSERYKNWCEHNSPDEAKQMIRSFLNGEEVILSLKQLPEGLQELIDWTAYEGYEFHLDDLIKKLDAKKITDIYGQEIRKGIISKDSMYFELRTNLGDQLVAEVLEEREKQAELDIPNVLKTIDLVRDIFLLKSEDLKIDIQKHFEKPIVLDMCLFDLLKCNPKVSLPQKEKPNGETVETDCRCKEKPTNDPCDCKCDEECIEQNPCCAEITPYIGELFIVKDEIVCYEPGEISYIENVMQTEIRERTHRHLQREETYSEQEEETSTYEERDLQVEETSTLHKEVDKIVEQDIGVNAGAQYANKKPGMRFSAYLNASYKQARKDAKRIVQSESKNVIDRAISRVEKKIRKFSSVKLLNEIEETNRHVFGGTNGAPMDLSRQYYFVNQVRKAQVYSYGYRMMIDINLPEPAALYKSLLEAGFDMKRPVKPCINIEEISTEDYLEYVQCYGFLDLEMPPKESITIPVIISGGPNPPLKDKNDLRNNQFEHKSKENFVVPDGYSATRMKIAGYNSTHRDQDFWSKVSIMCGNAQLYIEHTGDKDNPWWKADKSDKDERLPNLIGNQFLNITNWNTTSYDITINIICTIDAETILKWKIDVFNRIMAQYNQRLKEYEAAKAEFERRKQSQFNQNPFLLKTKIVEQLKHHAITYISCQFFDENDAMKNRVMPCGYPQMDIQEAKKEGDFFRFLEMAFDWQFMNYMLYQFSYGRKCKWAEMLKEASPNGLFTKFLQAGFARVTIPVNEGFENHITSYLINRRISPYNIPSIPQNMVPIHEEIKEMKQNFNTDRDGHIIHDTTIASPVLGPNQIFLRDNLDYFISSTYNQTEADKDKDREIFINCHRYRIMSIDYDAATGEVMLTLDRPFEEEKDKEWDWSTGAVFVGAAWKFKVPTKLVWLRKEGGCLPCYPIECDDYSNSGS